MGKIIRKTYPLEFSIGLLLLVFAISMFLSGQIFEIPIPTLNAGKNLYVGMFMISCAVVVMFLVLWEEFLFPVKDHEEEESAVYRNHRTKLKMQVLIYLIIPVIFIFIYNFYEVNQVRFFIWAAICVIAPVVGKLISGINNYNDFLTMTKETIEYKNNEKVGTFDLKDVKQIMLIKDEGNVMHKFQIELITGEKVTIDLDEMELEAYFNSIEKYITTKYKSLLA